MQLLLSLASILGLEAEELLTRLRKNAGIWAAILGLVLIALAFLLLGLYIALREWLGPLWAALAIAGAALVLALGLYLGMRIAASVARRRADKRRRASEKTALATTAAMTAAPLLLRSSLMRTIGLPLGGALAVYLLIRNGQRHDPPAGGNRPD